MDTARIDSADKIELMRHLQTLGHSTRLLSRMNLAALRKLAHSGKRYDPQTRTVFPPTTEPPMQSQHEAQPASPASGGKGVAALLEALIEDLGPRLTADIKGSLQAEFNAALDHRPRRLEVTIKPDERTVDVGLAHESFPDLLDWAIDRQPVYLYGPAGSGKSTAGQQVAKALGLPFYLMSFGPASQAHDLLGYRDAGTGTYHASPFYQAYKHGGVCLWDEFDASPDVMVIANAALANGHFTFPNAELVSKHADCIIIGAGNTIGLGATDEYVSRQRQDAATRNRFAFMRWDYDEALELGAAGEDQIKWVRHVQRLRKAHRSLGASASPDLLISPRASIIGARRLRRKPDTSWNMLEEALIWQGCTDDERQKIQQAANKLPR
jgi:hypothetical protein